MITPHMFWCIIGEKKKSKKSNLDEREELNAEEFLSKPVGAFVGV